MILALDTSGLELLVALVADGEDLPGRALPGPRHQDQVIQVIGEVAGDRLARIEAVAVTNGPGSHTGLRVGLATASGIAFARRLPIYPLSSLAVAAQRAPAETAIVIAAVAAGRGRVYVQPFERAGNGYRAGADRHLETVAALAARAAEGVTVAAEPALLAQLGQPASDRGGVRALTAAVVEAVGAIQPVTYDQLRGDYGEF